MFPSELICESEDLDVPLTALVMREQESQVVIGRFITWSWSNPLLQVTQ